MADQFEIGDIVSLKSGGPAMTVEDIGDDGFGKLRVYCVWFDDKKTHQMKDFAIETLQKN